MIKVLKDNSLYELNNDGNYVLVNKNIGICLKCGRELNGNGVDGFCDNFCKREYYLEVSRDMNGFKGE